MTTTSERPARDGWVTPHRPGRHHPLTLARIGLCTLVLTVAGSIASVHTSNRASAAPGDGMVANAALTVQVTNIATYGDILTNETGLAVYTLNTDQGAQSTCTGACAAAWPALTVPSGANPAGGTGVTGVLGTAEQSNGTFQVTYNGSLLYTFEGDTPGQVTGQEADGFSVVTLSTVTTPTTTTTTTTTSPTNPTLSTTSTSTPTSPTTSTTTSSTSTTSTTLIPTSSVGATTTTTSAVAAVVSSPSSTGNTGSGSTGLAFTGLGNDAPVASLVGIAMIAGGIIGRRRLVRSAHRSERSLSE